MDPLIRLGPVLSFRGMVSNGEPRRWRVSALLGYAGEVPPPLLLEGRAVPAPTLLLERGRVRYYRYDLSVDLSADERRVRYTVGATEWSFTAPASAAAPRLAYVSCNGFSDPSAMRKLPGQAGAVWEDLLCNHDKAFRPQRSTKGAYKLDKEQLWHEERVHDRGVQRFHLLLMGGDQIYFDSIWEDIPALKSWIKLSRPDQVRYKPTPYVKTQIENYYFDLYEARWLNNKGGSWTKGLPLDAAHAMASTPTVMMWDDHDIFDGWGSYSADFQASPLFQWMFHCARRAFWVFQLQHAVDALPPLNLPAAVASDDPQFSPIVWSQALRNDPLALPLLDDQPGFTSAFHIGPVALLTLDLRTERSKRQILSEPTWRAVQRWMWSLRSRTEQGGDEDAVQHLLVMSSVPVAHPKLSLAESALGIVGTDDVRKSSADDLQDHWSHDDHEGERKRLIESLTKVSSAKRFRAILVSGDVHVAAWGTMYRKDARAGSNLSEIHQFTASAVVHPSLSGLFERAFLAYLNAASSKPQAIDVEHEVRMMIFPGHGHPMMPARNWLALELDAGQEGNGRKLWATWRCEAEKAFSNHLYAVHPAA